MTDIRKPRRGSLAFRPRKRAKNQNVRVYWQDESDQRVLGFPGYKVGMTHLSRTSDPKSTSKGQKVFNPATVVEVPPVLVYGLRCYDSVRSLYDIFTDDKKALKAAGLASRPKSKEPCGGVRDVRLLVVSLPSMTTTGKKHPEKMEIGIGGENASKLEYAKGLLGKELKLSEVFRPGERVDVIGVTKGKGWQGPVKRFGVKIQRRKATGRQRHVGTLGPFHPAVMMYTAPHAGQTGYHTRTEYNKEVLKIGDDAGEINPSSGFPRYGFVKNDYVLLKGSIPGPSRRMVKLRLSVRGKPGEEPQISSISTDPK